MQSEQVSLLGAADGEGQGAALERQREETAHSRCGVLPFLQLH